MSSIWIPTVWSISDVNYVVSFNHTCISNNCIIQQLLHILTAVWVLPTPNAGQNLLFVFWAKNAEKARKRKIKAKLIKKVCFASLHPNPGRGFYSHKKHLFDGKKRQERKQSMHQWRIQKVFNKPIFLLNVASFSCYFFHFSAFTQEKCWKSIFKPEFVVCSTQTLVKIYN